MSVVSGGFTLPGETGFEEFTLAMAKKVGADVIRDSDGTRLSDEILNAGYGIYSTLCLIREDNEWAKANPDKLQQNFLMSFPVTAGASSGTEKPGKEKLQIDLLDGYFTEQFVVNDWDGMEFWQVFNRTTGAEVPASDWSYAAGKVTIAAAEPGHTYTVNFLVSRIWEEISMYNHTTNNWDKEHLRAIEPRHPEAAAHILQWLEQWCIDNPDTTVIRFTSLFYNFAWFWGSDPDLPHIYGDWAGYDFTVNPIALREFKAKTGLEITSEDFVNAGRYTSSHNPPSPVYRAWMEFVQDFVLELGKKCVEIAHKYGKKAYVFYDDSWVGVEPNSPRFQEYGFDGLIKSLFSGYEARLCAAADVPIHEVRLHPYLFPVDLEGKPTFQPGGDPTADARAYWTKLRRALLQVRVDRIGLGGYLSLIEPFPDFQDYIAQVADEHRLILGLHDAGGPASAPVRVAVLTAWGALRTWTTSGHLHENPNLVLTHVLESLAGLGFEVSFISLDDVAQGSDRLDYDVVINAGDAGSAWSGGDAWREAALVTALRNFVARGGGLLGVGQPSAVAHSLNFFQLADVLGVDQDQGDRIRMFRRSFEVAQGHPAQAGGNQWADLPALPGLHLSRRGVTVLAEREGLPVATAADYGQGRAIYFSGHRHSPAGVRRLANAIWWAAGKDPQGALSSNPAVDAVHYPGAGQLVLSNWTLEPQTTTVTLDGNDAGEFDLAPGELRVLPQQAG